MDDKTIEAELEAAAQRLLTPALLEEWRSPLKRLPLPLMPEHKRLLACALLGDGLGLKDECESIVNNWLGARVERHAKKVNAGGTAPAKVHTLPGIPSSEIIEGFRLPLKNPDWSDKLRHMNNAANHYTKPFDDGLSALVQRGGQGKPSHTWNPARFAVRLIEAKVRNYSAAHASIENHWEEWLPEFDDLVKKRGLFQGLEMD